MAQQKKTTTKKSTASTRTAKTKKRPIRREVGGGVCLLLAICIGVSYFQTGALLIDWLRKVSCGLVGYGYYLMLPALLLCAYALIFHHGKPVTARVVCTLLLPVLIGAMIHIVTFEGEITPSIEALRGLWGSGIEKASGGMLAGALAIGFLAVLGKVATLIIFALLTVMLLLVALRLTPAAIIAAVRSHERTPYEPEEEEERSAPVRKPEVKAPKKAANIDIPLDGEEKTAHPIGGFFTRKPDDVKTPDELLTQSDKPTIGAEPKFTLMHSEKNAAPEPIAPTGAEKIKGEEIKAETDAITKEIEAGSTQKPAYAYPPITLLDQGIAGNAQQAGAELRNNARRLSETLASFGVDAQPGEVVRGPSVTRYEFTLDQGVKLSKITNLQDDIALALGASGVRIAPIPDKISVVGIEL